MVKVSFMYRCGANYKTYFSLKYPKTDLKPGDEIEMGEYGTPYQDDFFSSGIHEYSYDEEHDHNLLEVIDVKPV